MPNISLPLSQLRLDGGTQPRAALDEDIIAEYADCMQAGDVFPPVVVFHDGTDYWLADGFHRWYAALRTAGGAHGELACDIRQGTQRDAILYSVGANAAHGLRRSNADKRQAVITLLNDPEWKQWSNNEIAKRCAIDSATVDDIRRKISLPDSGSERTYTTKHGTVAVMNVANIGKSNGHGQPPAPVLVSDPPAESGIWKSDHELSREIEAARLESAPARARVVTGAEFAAEVLAPTDAQPEWWQSSTTDDWHTPQWLFDILHKEFKFKLDVCATAKSAKCKRYFTRRDDGLKQTWRGVCWMNPPYGREIGAWIEKAHQSAKDGATIACLVPARTDTAWWWDYCTRGEIRFLRGRLQFSKAENGAPFPSALVIFYPGVPKRNAKTIWWSVSDDNL